MPADYAIDTNGLASLLTRDFDPGRIEAALRAADARLVLMEVVISEWYDGGDDATYGRFARLVRLADALPADRFAIAISGSEILRMEQRGERIVEQPLYDSSVEPSWFKELRAGRETFLAARAARRDGNTAFLAKAETEEIDRRATAATKKTRQPVADSVDAILGQLRETFLAGEWPTEAIVAEPYVADAEVVRGRITADPARARAHAIYHGLSWMYPVRQPRHAGAATVR